jgi:hypothetical protein
MIWYHGLNGFIVDVILDLGHMSQMMQHDDQPFLAIVNKVGQPKVALPMIMNFPSSHVFCDDGPNMILHS